MLHAMELGFPIGNRVRGFGFVCIYKHLFDRGRVSKRIQLYMRLSDNIKPARVLINFAGRWVWRGLRFWVGFLHCRLWNTVQTVADSDWQRGSNAGQRNEEA